MPPEPATLPQPPYFAAIFTSVFSADGDRAAYSVMAARMKELAASMPGFLGMESVRGDDGFGITVSYWATEEAIRAWQQHAEHLQAQRLGREEWYGRYELRIARVERAYGKPIERGR